MHWYKQAKISDWKSLLITIPVSVLIGLAIGKGWLEKSPQDIQNRIIQEYNSPLEAQEDLQEVQELQVQYGLQEEYINSSNIPSNRPESLSEPVSSPVVVDIEKIIEIESVGDTTAISPKGARGIMQIMPDTWEDIVGRGKMETYWPIEDIEDPVKNRQVGEYYMNIEIPRLLNHYGLPDTIYTRLTAYNWGIGHLKNTYERYGSDWMNHLPEETSNYFIRYGL